jgi:hypothetical protein
MRDCRKEDFGMHFKSIAFIGCAAVIALAPQAFAMGGGGGHSGGGVSGTFTGTANGAKVAGTFTAMDNGSSGGSENFTGSANVTGDMSKGGASAPLAAAEPLSAFAVGLGLIGARLLRRRV